MEQLALSISQVCRVANVGRTRVYELLRSGDLPARKLGKRTLVLKSDLEKWLASLPDARS